MPRAHESNAEQTAHHDREPKTDLPVVMLEQITASTVFLASRRGLPLPTSNTRDSL